MSTDTKNLIDNERIFQAIHAMVKVGGWELDVLTDSLYWTDETYLIHDLSPDEYTPTVETAIDFYTDESLLVITAALNEAIATGKGYDLELELVTAKCRRVWVQSYATVTMVDGKAVKVTGAFQDITQKKLTATAVKESEFLFRSQFDLGNVGLAITSPDKNWLNANPMLIKMLGYSADELFQLTWPELTHPDDFSAEEQQYARMLAGEINSYELEKRVFHKNNSVIYVYLAVACYREFGKVKFVMASLLDISERKRAEQQLATFNKELEVRVEQRTSELKKAQQETELAMEAKSQFLANISHEIRTPMNGILGIAEVLKLTDLDATQQQYVQVMQRSGNTLLSVINDVLDYSKLDVDKVVLEHQPINISNLISEVLEPYRLAASAQQKISLSLDPSLKDMVLMGDAMRLHQVLSNLLSNACKFTEQGSICLQVTSQPSRDNHCTLRFEVIDSGIGLDPKQHDQLLQPFTQADHSTSRRYGGTGLGLSICVQILKLMGSNLAIESVLGEGATFSFNVNFELCKSNNFAPTTDDLPIKHSAIKVLLVEDNVVNRLVCTKLLESLGAIVETANDGEEAVGKIIQQHEVYSLVLMDCEMPVMGGYEATAIIRKWELENNKQRMRIHALTAHALTGHVDQSIEAGMDGHCSKPITLNVLQNLLHSTINL